MQKKIDISYSSIYVISYAFLPLNSLMINDRQNLKYWKNIKNYKDFLILDKECYCEQKIVLHYGRIFKFVIPVRSTKQETTTANQRKQTTKKIQAKCNRLISNWKNQNYIDKWETKRLRRYNSVIAKTYG